MAIEYQWKWDGDGEPIECDSCRSDVPVFDFPRMEVAENRRTMALCELCAGCHAGSAHQYPRHYADPHLYETICHVGNSILTAINGRRRPLVTPDKEHC